MTPSELAKIETGTLQTLTQVIGIAFGICTKKKTEKSFYFSIFSIGSDLVLRYAVHRKSYTQDFTDVHAHNTTNMSVYAPHSGA